MKKIQNVVYEYQIGYLREFWSFLILQMEPGWKEMLWVLPVFDGLKVFMGIQVMEVARKTESLLFSLVVKEAQLTAFNFKY